MNETRTEVSPSRHGKLSRRQVLKAAAAAASLAAATPTGKTAAAKPVKAGKPNLLLIICDQLGLDALGAHGWRDGQTPNLDRLIGRGTTFMESHSTNPVCSPARSSLMTGRMATETGVITNGRPIHASCPNLGQWLRPAGYETVYCGKWHLPGGYPARIDGFTVLPIGGGQGDLADTIVSRSCEAFIKNRSSDRPYLMVASFMQPHDICYWGNARANRMPAGLPFAQLRDLLPALPPNNTARPKAPEALGRTKTNYNEDQWRYYLYLYARMIEMLDADVGRVLDAVEAAGQAEDTVILFTSDHGDGRGRHMHVSKWYPYEESVKVPMIVSCPGRVTQGNRDATHLVSGVDVMPTMCDYAGVKAPKHVQGRSLRPLLEGKNPTWREFVVSDFRIHGRVVRTPRYKYVSFKGDPVEQLFDMKADPWETRNLYDQAAHAATLKDHRKLLADFEAQLRPVEPTRGAPRPRRRPKRPAPGTGRTPERSTP